MTNKNTVIDRDRLFSDLKTGAIDVHFKNNQSFKLTLDSRHMPSNTRREDIDASIRQTEGETDGSIWAWDILNRKWVKFLVEDAIYAQFHTTF